MFGNACINEAIDDSGFFFGLVFFFSLYLYIVIRLQIKLMSTVTQADLLTPPLIRIRRICLINGGWFLQMAACSEWDHRLTSFPEGELQ